MTTEIKHTPGPWYVDEEGNGDINIVAGRKLGHGQWEHGVIWGCGCCGSPGGNGAHSDADARLISASPELLNALQASRSLLSCHVGPDDDLGNVIIDQMDAAIAKATGETE